MALTKTRFDLPAALLSHDLISGQLADTLVFWTLERNFIKPRDSFLHCCTFLVASHTLAVTVTPVRTRNHFTVTFFFLICHLVL